jgi:hypothetical protein
MNRHVGASFTLSVMVVIFFAVALYPSDRKRATVSLEPLASPSTTPPGPAGPPSTAPTPVVPSPETTPVSVPEPPRVAVLEQAPGPPEREANAAPPRVRVISRTRAVSAPRSAFTVVSDGESLDDVAARVYGTTDRAEWLWLSNRDLIERKDASLRAGMLLRTP